MSWEVYDKVRDFVQEVGMSARPEFYSGRDATLGDLNNKQLEGIYQKIVTEFGEEAGKNFIQMVSDIKVLSATRFLTSLYALCRNDWKWNENQEGSDIAFDGYMTALGTLGSKLFGGDRDETQSIKGKFLEDHGIKSNNRMYRDSYYGRSWRN